MQTDADAEAEAEVEVEAEVEGAAEGDAGVEEQEGERCRTERLCGATRCCHGGELTMIRTQKRARSRAWSAERGARSSDESRFC